MAGTTAYIVPAGTVSAPIPVNFVTTVLIGPSVLGGSAQLEFSVSQSGPWFIGIASTLSPASFRLPPPGTSGYVRVTATTQIANVAVIDMGSANTPTVDQLASINTTFASASSTAEQILGSIRLPPNFVPLNSNLRLTGNVSMVNNAGVKTLQCRVNGLAGTLFFQSPALASNANYNFHAFLAFRGDGVTMAGFGAGSAGGLGLSTTAYTSLVRDYIGQETEIVVSCTKGTAGDLMQLESLVAQLF